MALCPKSKHTKEISPFFSESREQDCCRNEFRFADPLTIEAPEADDLLEALMTWG